MSVDVDTFGSYVSRNKQDENYFIELNFVLETYFDYFYNLVSNRRDLPIGPVEVYEVTLCGFHVANQILFSHEFLSQSKKEDLSFLAAAILFAAIGTYMENYQLGDKEFYRVAIGEKHGRYKKSYISTWVDLVPLIRNFCPHFVFDREIAAYKANVEKLKTENIPYEKIEEQSVYELDKNINSHVYEFAALLSKKLNNEYLE